jgi:hypothetical protein
VQTVEGFMYNALKVLVDGKPNKPMIVLTLGFLTKQNIDSFDRDWIPSVQRFCFERGFGLAYFYWDSKNLGCLVRSFQPTEMKALALSQATTQTISKTWADARTSADLSLNMLYEMLNMFKQREVILVGHSLGARLLLKLASNATPKSYRQIIALATACDVGELNVQAIKDSTTKGCISLYSTHDAVLKYMFPLGQDENIQQQINQSNLSLTSKLLQTATTLLLPKSRALGAGAHQIGIEEIDATAFCAQMGHLDYSKHIYKILSRLVV